MIKPAYYYEEYDDVPQIRRSRRPVRRVVREVRIQHRELRKPESNIKEDKVESSKSCKTRASKPVQVKEENQEVTTEDDESKSRKENGDETNGDEEKKGNLITKILL